jgi:hypothetical protein
MLLHQSITSPNPFSEFLDLEALFARGFLGLETDPLKAYINKEAAPLPQLKKIVRAHCRVQLIQRGSRD